MVKLIIAGACGRMGGRIIALAEQSKDVSVAAAFEHPDHPKIGEEVAPGVRLKGMLDPILESGDVLIDFTEHTATLNHLRLVANHGKAAVVGTTGFSPEELDQIQALSSTSSMVVAPNMSVGVNLMFKIARDMATILDDAYDIEVLEAHHRLKKDAPSGTAVKLAEVLADARGNNLQEVGVFSRRGHIGQRSDGEIGVQTIRAGDIVGEHTVLFAGPGERLELTHRAHSRDNFARGAITAARWVVNQPNGLYDMQNVLGLK